MPGCAAPFCSNSAVKGFVMRRLPTDPQRRVQWAVNMNRPGSAGNTNLYLCEIHFEPSMWENRQDRKTKLKPNAIPTIFFDIHGKRRNMEEDTLPGSSNNINFHDKDNVSPNRMDSCLISNSPAVSSKKSSTTSHSKSEAVLLSHSREERVKRYHRLYKRAALKTKKYQNEIRKLKLNMIKLKKMIENESKIYNEEVIKNVLNNDRFEIYCML